MLRTRPYRSGCPWGRKPRWDTLADMKSIAEALGQAATQAPHPMQMAASMEMSASVFFMGVALASWALPVRTEI